MNEDGERHGRGIYTYANGEKYIGDIIAHAYYCISTFCYIFAHALNYESSRISIRFVVTTSNVLLSLDKRAESIPYVYVFFII